jgi:hyperosmotically inducible periplasmic protein
MLKKVSTAFAAVICGLAMGCTENNPPASVAKSTIEGPTKITANRPITAATNESVDRTNTGINVRDRDSTAKTPFDQFENKADIKVTADIRKQILESKLSVNAQNVKVITQDGKVTLRGPVKTEQEKRKIEEIALAIAGADKVDSQLEVKID